MFSIISRRIAEEQYQKNGILTMNYPKLLTVVLGIARETGSAKNIHYFGTYY